MSSQRQKNPWDIKANYNALFSRGHGNTSALDGARALALLWVVSFHTSMYIEMGDSSSSSDSATQLWTDAFISAFPGNGTLGVDLFFVLSGYLMAQNWLREVSKFKSFSIGRFYLRRFLRIWPALAMAVALQALFDYWTGLVPTSYCTTGWYLVLTFVNNIWGTQCTFQTWSVAVEFQMYLVTPFAMLLCFSPARNAPRMFGFTAMALLGFVGPAVSLYYLVKYGVIDSKLVTYNNTFCRSPAYVAGMFFAMALHASQSPSSAPNSDTQAQAPDTVPTTPSPTQALLIGQRAAQQQPDGLLSPGDLESAVAPPFDRLAVSSGLTVTASGGGAGKTHVVAGATARDSALLPQLDRSLLVSSIEMEKGSGSGGSGNLKVAFCGACTVDFGGGGGASCAGVSALASDCAKWAGYSPQATAKENMAAAATLLLDWAALALGLAIAYIGDMTSENVTLLKIMEVFGRMGFGFSLGRIISAVVQGRLQLVGAILKLQCLIPIAALSYSTYLLQQMALPLMPTWSELGITTTYTAWATFEMNYVFVVVLSTCYAIPSYFLIERPCSLLVPPRRKA